MCLGTYRCDMTDVTWTVVWICHGTNECYKNSFSVFVSCFISMSQKQVFEYVLVRMNVIQTGSLSRTDSLRILSCYIVMHKRRGVVCLLSRFTQMSQEEVVGRYECDEDKFFVSQSFYM